MSTSSFAANRIVTKHVVRSRGGIVAAQNRRAAEIGAAVLAAGGNAVDAACTVSFTMAVLEPWMSGLGGGGTMLVHLAREGRTRAVDFGMVAPRALDPADYPLTGGVAGDLFGWPAVLEDRNLQGPLAIAVPGVVDGIGLALETFGTRPLAEIMAPAIGLAERGMPVDWWASLMVTTGAGDLARYPASREIWLPGGLPPAPDPLGEEKHLPLPGLAATLAEIAADGRRAFYEGPIARRIAADVQALGGQLAFEDLAGYRARLVEPLTTRYRGQLVAAMPGLYAGATLARCLGLLEEVALGDEPDAAAFQSYAGALDQGYAERLASMGDSAAAPSCTTHIGVVDREGNLVALTQTLLSLFGSKVVLPGTGILMNNGIMWFDPRPGGPNALAPGGRPLSNMCPTLAFAADGRALALGASGGRKILPAVLQILSFVLDYGMTLDQAFAQPRLDATGGGIVTLDARLPEEVRAAVARRFEVRAVPPMIYPLGFACPVAVLRDGDGINHGTAEIMQPWADAVAEPGVSS